MYGEKIPKLRKQIHTKLQAKTYNYKGSNPKMAFFFWDSFTYCQCVFPSRKQFNQVKKDYYHVLSLSSINYHTCVILKKIN